jgi:AhpD family alkylhydroperoxidase
MEGLQTGILDEKTMALIAVGTAYGITCHPCLKKCVSMAKETGANGEEIWEAMKVARQVRDGASRKIEGWAEELLQGNRLVEKEGKCC